MWTVLPRQLVEISTPLIRRMPCCAASARGGDAAGVVVVGERQQAAAVGGGQAHDFLRLEGAVGYGGMAVQIDHGCGVPAA